MIHNVEEVDAIYKQFTGRRIRKEGDRGGQVQFYWIDEKSSRERAIK